MNNKKNIDVITANIPDFYCVVKDDDHDFYWVINLEDHPNSFLLDKGYQHLVSQGIENNQQSMVIIQPVN